jgi:putative SOS response-associated peptidase YedK
MITRMCGRFILNSPLVELQRAFEFSETPNMMARYTIAPTQRVPIVRNHPGREMTIMRRSGEAPARELVTARWGLVPPPGRRTCPSAAR